MIATTDHKIVARHGDLAIVEKRVGHDRFAVVRMDSHTGDTMVADLAYRVTEKGARRAANRIWKLDRLAEQDAS